MAIIVIYGIIVERGFRTSLVCRDPFGKLLAVGLSIAMALQVFVVIGGVTTPHPADRSDHAVPVVRRVLARRQLDHHRAAAAHQ